MQTVGSLLLTNSSFRLFLSDLQTIGRDVFKDSAFSASRAAEDVGHVVDPESSLADIPRSSKNNEQPPTQEELVTDAKALSATITESVANVSKDTKQSLSEHLSGSDREALLNRLRAAVGNLRQRKDYTEASSTIGTLLQRYAMTYSRALEDTLEATHEDIDANPETEAALKNFWSLLSSFGDPEEWTKLQGLLEEFVQKHRRTPDFEKLASEIGSTIQKVLTDPDYLVNVDHKIDDLSDAFNKTGNDTPVRQEIDVIFNQVQQTYRSVANDEDISKMLNTVSTLAALLSPLHASVNHDLLQDLMNVFSPLLIQAIQYIPIPRLEVSVPEMDLLLENLIIEPGKTVNNTSFFPFRFKVETYNDLEIRKAHVRTVSKVKSLLTLKIDGLSLRADDIGFWLRAHSGLFRLADEGIASFQLDERGMDIHLDVELGQVRLERVLNLKAVRVHIHKLSYDLSKSKFTWLAWLLKPVLRPIIRRIMQRQLANAIADLIHAANREIVYARERLRATRIADPQDLATFAKAVMTRLTPEADPDLYTRIGVAQPGKGVFKGVYAPGSVVKVWNQQASRAPEVIDYGGDELTSPLKSVLAVARGSCYLSWKMVQMIARKRPHLHK